MLAKAFPLLSVVVLLFPMGFFTLASPPLLVLRHDTPNDARFIRGLFDLYYRVLMVLGALGAAGCAIAGQGRVALAMAALVVFVFAIRRWLVGRMDAVRGEMTAGEAAAVCRFRRLHVGGMALNVAQLAVAAWGLTRLVG